MKQKIKIADKRGRITLGRKWANKKVMIEYLSPTEIKITMIETIHKVEDGWLLRAEYSNKK